MAPTNVLKGAVLEPSQICLQRLEGFTWILRAEAEINTRRRNAKKGARLAICDILGFFFFVLWENLKLFIDSEYEKFFR